MDERRASVDDGGDDDEFFDAAEEDPSEQQGQQQQQALPPEPPQEPKSVSGTEAASSGNGAGKDRGDAARDAGAGCAAVREQQQSQQQQQQHQDTEGGEASGPQGPSQEAAQVARQETPAGEMTMRVVNKDTGEVFDIRELEEHIPMQNYSLFPSKEQMIQRQLSGEATAGGSDDEDDDRGSAGGHKGGGVLRFAKKMWKRRGGGARGPEHSGGAAAASGGGGGGGGGGAMGEYIGEEEQRRMGNIPVTCVKKERQEFVGLKECQTVGGHDGPVWTMQFSPDGKYLASAGQDCRLVVWEVRGFQGNGGASAPAPADAADGQQVNRLTEPEQLAGVEAIPPTASGSGEDGWEAGTAEGQSPRRRSRARSNSGGLGGMGFSLLAQTPLRIYTEHTGDIIDLSWSRSNFLLSASIDRTVRLWHVSREDCLQTFKHVDFVTAVDFHPVHDRYFVSGCFDRKLRIWDIMPEGHVKEWAQAPEMITSACFSPDGSMAVAGLYHGQVFFYQVDGMKYYTQIECKNRRGQNRGGKKVTGLCFVPASESTSGPGSASVAVETKPNRSGARSVVISEDQLLATTNDSRLRLFQLEDYSMVCKYKGLCNEEMQIRAHISEDGRFIICGSETGQVYIWHTSLLHAAGTIPDDPVDYEALADDDGVEDAVAPDSYEGALEGGLLMDSNANRASSDGETGGGLSLAAMGSPSAMPVATPVDAHAPNNNNGVRGTGIGTTHLAGATDPGMGLGAGVGTDVDTNAGALDRGRDADEAAGRDADADAHGEALTPPPGPAAGGGGGGFRGFGHKDRNRAYEMFTATESSPAVATAALFAPTTSVRAAARYCGCMARLREGRRKHYMADCTRVILAADYDGYIKVYALGMQSQVSEPTMSAADDVERPSTAPHPSAVAGDENVGTISGAETAARRTHRHRTSAPS